MKYPSDKEKHTWVILNIDEDIKMTCDNFDVGAARGKTDKLKITSQSDDEYRKYITLLIYGKVK